MESQRSNNKVVQPESPRLIEPISPRIRRSASPSLGVNYDNMYLQASTSSSPRKTVLRRTSSSLSFQTISGLDDNSADFDEGSYEYSDKSNHEHHHHGIEKDDSDHTHLHENYHGNGSHDHGYSLSAHVKQLPTLSYIFSSLPPSQKTLFTWGTIHLFLGILLWLKGQFGCGLALTGFAYLVIFDALGVFTIFISNVIAIHRSLRESTIRNPFGVQRYEILFGFVNTLYLLFVALYMLKEGLEHFILETSEEHVEGDGPDFPIIWVLLALGATFISAIGYRNHMRFLTLLRSTSSVIRTHPSNYWQSIVTNSFTLSTLLCGTSVIVVGVLIEQNHSLGWLDKLVSILESMLMFYLAGPITIALSKILLQTTPDAAIRTLEACLREIQLYPTILSFTSTHFWTNSYGQLVGTICVQVNPDANEQDVLEYIHSRLIPLFVNNDGECELTVQIVK